jgi:predicted amidohydrolase YtcJ
VKGNRVAATGTTAQIKKLAGKNTRIIQLDGKTVVPGFNDAHDHPGEGGVAGQSYRYNEMQPAGPSREAVLDSIRQLLNIAKPGEWISGPIGTLVLFDPGMRAALDSLAPDNPVALEAWWGHGHVLNANALELCGLSDSSMDPVGGWYDRVAGTRKIFAIHENAEAPIWFTMKQAAPERLVAGIKRFSTAQLEYGITSVQYMGTGFKGSEAKKVFASAALKQRVRIVAWPGSSPSGRRLQDWPAHKVSISPLAAIDGIKYVIDGTPIEGNMLSKTAHTADGRNGRLNYAPETIRQILAEALRDNRQLMMHITGDSTLAVVLGLMKVMATPAKWREKRVRIEHNSTPLITSSEAADLKSYGLLVMHTPKYSQASPLNSLLTLGVIVGIAPDIVVNPFYDIMVITSQQIRKEENLSREQAVIAYTTTNAFAEFQEEKKGKLIKGMLADLAVLSADIFTVPDQQLPGVVSVLTMVDGKIVFQR